MTIPVFYPMGAVTEKKEEKLEALWLDPNWVAERKYDGSRYLIKKDNGKVSVTSRQPSKATGLPVDKTENVPHLVEIFQHMPDGSVIDGEIITHENCESHEVTRIMGAKPEKALQRQREEGLVKYVIFDILYYKGRDLTGFKYYERRKALETVYKNYLSASHFLLAPVEYKNKEQFYFDLVEGGGEGVILKNINATYEISFEGNKPKKPKNNWVKVKKYDTYDCVVMGFTEPTMEYSGKDTSTWQFWYNSDMEDYRYKENMSSEVLMDGGYIPVTKPFYNNWCGAIRFGQYKDGELIEVGQTSGIDDDTKLMLSLNPSQYIGKVIEVGAMRQNKGGALIHPRFLHFRNDKNPEQCILGEV